MKKTIVAGLYVLCCFAFGIVAIEEANAGVPMMTLAGLSLYSGGSGTEADPYLIACKAELLTLAENTNDYDKCFLMTADIDLADTNFSTAVISPDTDNTDLSFQGMIFTGRFDGGGHVISNLVIDAGNASGVGLFGRSSGIITNLGVVNCFISNGQYCTGGICGANYGKISQCYSTGAIDGMDQVGGLCGGSTGIISRCHSAGPVNGRACVGGLCGASSGTINYCYATGSVSGTYYNCYSMGGMCGYNERGVISQCYSTGSVSGESITGGLCGINEGMIRDCYSTGTISGKTLSGGFCGFNLEGSISNCFWNIETSGQTTSYGGIGGTTTEMQNQSTFTDAGWDFVGETVNGTNSTWYMDGYPRLRCFAACSMLSFDKWALVEGIPTGMRGEKDCPAGDDISNLMKYACGLPAMQECSLKDIMTIVKAAEDVFAVRYVKSKKTADSMYMQPVWSTSLSGPWTSSNMTDVLVSEGEMQEERMVSIPLGARGFLRLLVSRVVLP